MKISTSLMPKEFWEICIGMLSLSTLIFGVIAAICMIIKVSREIVACG